MRVAPLNGKGALNTHTYTTSHNQTQKHLYIHIVYVY